MKACFKALPSSKLRSTLLLVWILLLVACMPLQAQIDSLFNRSPKDTTQNIAVQDAIYNRPFIYMGKTSTAVGGYLEGNTNYFVTDGIGEGFSMELRRFNIFLYSTIARRIKFLSELEFEHGTKEISLETALIDFEISPAFNLRTGIIVVPIGAFNQNHDSPKWEFIDRPLVSTQIIPATLSEVGFGFHGKIYGHNKVFTYDAYIVNGLRDEIILNAEGRTFLQAGKNPEMFSEDNNGIPMISGKVALKHRKIGEVGLSYYGGVYNTFKVDGVKIDSKRNLSIYAIDFNTAFKKAVINGEFAYTRLDLPPATGPFYGNQQWGGYVELVYTLLKRKVLNYANTSLNANIRLEAIDYNLNNFDETGKTVGDEVKAFVAGMSIRPSSNTVLRVNYRYHWIKDLLANPISRKAGFQVGFASYF